MYTVTVKACKHTANTIPKNSKQKYLLGHSPNSYIHVSVCDLYIPTIDLPILLQDPRNI